MARAKLPVSSCSSCPHLVFFHEEIPRKQNGVIMRPGERYCTGFKKARCFAHSDPRVNVPSWCPKRKSPCELRVYCFKSEQDAFMHNLLSLDLGYAIAPQERRYRLLDDLTTTLTPKEFWNRCNRESDADTIGFDVQRYFVVEVDDGIAPACFYKTGNGYEIIRGFDTAKVQKDEEQK